MARFVITHRRAGKRGTHEHHRAREAMAEALAGPLKTHADLVGANRPAADHARHVAVFETGHEQVAALDWHPELIVEPTLDHHAGRVRLPEVGRADAQELGADIGQGREQVFCITLPDGRPARDVDVFFRLESAAGPAQVARRSDGRGRVRLQREPATRIIEIGVVPRAGYWPLAADSAAADLRLTELPSARHHLGWWHRAMGLEAWDRGAGSGMRVGLIDTGTGPHPALAHVHDLGSLVDGRHDPAAGNDSRGHGSHVAGLIGARPERAEDYGGLAPAAELFSVKVFGDAGAAHQGDIALALYELAHGHACHLVNLSLGTAARSAIEHDAIVDAADSGCLTVTAAGNTAGALEYPAAFDETVAVTAVGRDGAAPAGTLAAHRRPERFDWFGRGGLFLANFCCTGPGVDVTAPGVGIISTVPDGQAAYGGTSMAAPLVTGFLAAVLSLDAGFSERAADSRRTRAARRRLRQHCHDIGLAATLQGCGMPAWPHGRRRG